MLGVDGLEVSYGPVRALRGVTLNVAADAQFFGDVWEWTASPSYNFV